MQTSVSPQSQTFSSRYPSSLDRFTQKPPISLTRITRKHLERRLRYAFLLSHPLSNPDVHESLKDTPLRQHQLKAIEFQTPAQTPPCCRYPSHSPSVSVLYSRSSLARPCVVVQRSSLNPTARIQWEPLAHPIVLFAYRF